MTNLDTESAVVRVNARKGCNLRGAVKDALILALTEDRKVVLEFNDIEYEVDPHVVLDRILPRNGGTG